MLYKMTRDRFNRFVRATFKDEIDRGDIVQVYGTSVYINGLFIRTKILSDKLGIDVRDVILVDKEGRVNNIDTWRGYLRGKL